ncbi:uncharacterized protein LOC128616219 isoform X2 [Ictalurus furcatus]|nr:uncharacterized protein LOC128616219 isoform X2 [Ictalurus furcatus]
MDPILEFKRNYLLCEKTWDCLSVHLHRVCMKTDPEEAIEAVVERATAEMRVLLAIGRVINYGRLGQILGAADPISRLIEELESHFLVVTGVPPPLPPTSARAEPSSSRATQPTGLDSEQSKLLCQRCQEQRRDLSMVRISVFIALLIVFLWNNCVRHMQFYNQTFSSLQLHWCAVDQPGKKANGREGALQEALYQPCIAEGFFFFLTGG